ncbi:YycH family regulatory protein [Falsibacillus albus]|uniref:Regulatory protein YycH domain-containing protein n=1 Tax=Falsibacillus albus TaxID=2478915 RepID=A0A3L7JTZ7_9BACI|nr:two-component system activity regulator YycH [Falsibacillus albus]RLQ93990.1 hypothetical protein D9X91_15245 [Falsibacillus albus]
MRYETIKSILLTGLVLTSIIVTWNLWTYQPDVELKPNDIVGKTNISDKVGVESLVKPIRILFHQDNTHYGTFNNKEMDAVINEMKKWTFYDFRNITSTISRQEFESIQHSNGRAEIDYPDEVPVSLYKSILNFEEAKIPAVDFNKIIINYSNASKNPVVYFLSGSGNSYKVYECTIRSNYLQAFKTEFVDSASKKYYEYLSEQINDQDYIYLPKGHVKIPKYRYYMSVSDSDISKFKNALFSDPSAVKKTQLNNTDEYTEGFSLMRVYKTLNELNYVNPGIETNISDNPNELIRKSIDFVNEHAGWTDTYEYFSMNPEQSKVSYILIKNGIPVFNEDGMSEIVQYWGKDEINKYIRPYFSLDVPLPFEEHDVELPNGTQVLQYLQSNPDIKPELLQGFMIGYKLSIDPQSPKQVILNPSWYYLDSGNWIRLSLDEVGGSKGGLE